MTEKAGTELLTFDKAGITWRLSLDCNGEPHLEYKDRDVLGNLCWKEMMQNGLALKHPPFWLDMIKTVFFEACKR